MEPNEYGESDGILVSGVKTKELIITGLSVLLFLFQLENKDVDLITGNSLVFGIQINIPSDLLCPTTLILPHPTLIKTNRPRLHTCSKILL